MITSASPSIRNVHVAGIGLTPVGEHWEKALRELALEAITAAINDAQGLQPEAIYIANTYSSLLSGQSQLGALIADFAGFTGIEAFAVDADGASGGIAFRQAALAIQSGAINRALVLGVEKVTDKVTAEIDAARITAGDADYEAVHGVTRTAQAALLMRRYLHETGAPADALAGFSMTAHANAVNNPNAMFRRAITAEAYSRAPMISAPVNMFDAAPFADGAAAMLLTNEPLKHLPNVSILGSAAATAPPALHDQKDPLLFSAANLSASKALEQADLTLDQLDLFEPHDQFSIYAALSMEAVGFASRGEGWKLAQNGRIDLKGQIPILTFGGSKARGEAGGATGVYQLAEVALQLQSRAGKSQVEHARSGMAQSIGGSGGTAVSHILGTQP